VCHLPQAAAAGPARRNELCAPEVIHSQEAPVSNRLIGRHPRAYSPYSASWHAGQVVRRVLLRRNIVNAETARLVTAAVQAALRADAPSA